ncbi:hypothetical protein HYR99_03860 [Candidatus Poribacteria bacterium]|nr:hypothetical protein [Candidatus Poribacteria bacterium]
MELKIVDVTPENIEELDPESEQDFGPIVPVDAYNRKLAWARELFTKGFQRKIAFNEAGEKVGFIEYMPIEEALDNIVGENVNAIHCLWDQTDPEGGEPTRALLDVVEQESREVGRGVSFVGWRMKDLLIQRGYKITDEPEQPYFLALKAFEPNQNASFIPHMRTIPQVELIEGKVVVDVFWNVSCSLCAHGLGQLETVRQACKAAAEEVDDAVTLREHQLERADCVHYGTGDNIIVLINGKKWRDDCNIGGPEDFEPLAQRTREFASEVQDSSLG